MTQRTKQPKLSPQAREVLELLQTVIEGLLEATDSAGVAKKTARKSQSRLRRPALEMSTTEAAHYLGVQ